MSLAPTRRRRFALAALAALLGCWPGLRIGPLPAGLLDRRRSESTAVLARDGELLYEARAGDGSRASWLAADELPAPLVDATIAAEDRRFWRHPGIDPIAVAARRRAQRPPPSRRRGRIDDHAAGREAAAGAGGRRRRRRAAFTVKLREAIVAIRLEHRLTKREIMALYLNLASYGNQLTGAERASRAYFGRGAGLLTPAQAAFLAALPQRPTTFNPYRDAARARPRQQRILVQMGLQGLLPPDRVRRVAARAAHARSGAGAVHRAAFRRPRAGARGPDAAAADRHDARRGPAANGTGHHPRRAARAGSVRRTQRRGGRPRQPDGRLARVGGLRRLRRCRARRRDRRRNDAAAARLGAEAVHLRRCRSRQGESPATVLPDIPSSFPTGEDGVVYSPQNYDNQFRGPLLARRALAGSENVPAVALAARVGVPNLVRFLRTAGFTTFDQDGCVLRRRGHARRRRSPSRSTGGRLRRVCARRRRHRAALRRGRRPRPVDGERLVSERTAFWITDILSDDDARAFAFGRGGSLEFPFPVAAKTGTSQAYRDNWAIGYTRSVTVGVWVGNFDRRPLIGSSGVSGAGPIFHAIMLAAAQPRRRRLRAPAPTATVARARTHGPAADLRAVGHAGIAALSRPDRRVDADRRARPASCTWHQRGGSRRRGRTSSLGRAEYLAWARAVRRGGAASARAEPRAS